MISIAGPTAVAPVLETPSDCSRNTTPGGPDGGSVSAWRGREQIGALERGESAFAAAGLGAYRIVAEGERALVVKVSLPPYVD